MTKLPESPENILFLNDNEIVHCVFSKCWCDFSSAINIASDDDGVYRFQMLMSIHSINTQIAISVFK